jgi:hypothetical protein
MPLEEIVRRAIDSHLRFVASVGRLTVDSVREFMDPSGAKAPQPQTSAQAASAAPGSVPSMVLEAEAGKTAVGVFLVENSLPDHVDAAIVASSLLDPNGASHELTFVFDPPTISLDPREQVLVRVSALLPETLQPAIAYSGSISIPELKGTSVPVIVRRR